MIDGDGGTFWLDEQLIPVINVMLDLIKPVGMSGNSSSLIAERNLEIICAAGILCNITCNNKRYKEHIIAAGGTKDLINQYISNPDKPSIAEPILCTLRSVFPT